MHYISVCLSIISIIIAIVSIFKSHRSNKIASKASEIAIGNLEKSLRDSISNERMNMESKGENISEILANKKPSELNNSAQARLITAKKSFASAVEGWLNTYEEACSKYLDDKIDKKRFRKTYKTEIKNFIEGKKETKEIHELLFPEATSRYKCIWKVYKDWENGE